MIILAVKQSSDTAAVITSAQLGAERPQAPLSDSAEETLLRFNAERRAACPALRQWIVGFVQTLEADERARNPAKRLRRADDGASFALAVEALICNLIALRLLRKDRLTVPRSKEVMGRKSRYKSAVFGRGFVQAMDLMKAAEPPFLEQPTTGYSYASAKNGRIGRGKAQPTTIAPTERLLSALPVDAFRWDALAYAAPAEVLILKDAKDENDKKALIEYEDTPETIVMRDRVHRFNERLKSAVLEIVEANDCDFIPADPNERTLRRVFNNAKWREGGRLFGGFWEGMEKRHRFMGLRIDGEAIASADFGQLFLRLAYAEKGLQAPLGDLYRDIQSPLERDGVKTLVNALLCAGKPLRRYPEKLEHASCKTSFKESRQAIIAAHPCVADCFEKGLGYRLFYLESEILLDVLEGLDGLGITALPVHDCVLVAARHAQAAKRVMEQTFSKHCGGLQGVVALDFGPETDRKVTAPL